MRMLKLAACASVAVALVAGLAVARSAWADHENLEVRKGCEAFVMGWNAHDGKAMGARFTEDATMIDASGKLFEGRAAIEKELSAWHGPTGPMRESMLKVNDEPFKLITPDVAITDADVTVTNAYGPDGKKGATVNLVVTNVWKKSGDVWLVAASRARMKQSPPAEAPAK